MILQKQDQINIKFDHKHDICSQSEHHYIVIPWILPVFSYGI